MKIIELSYSEGKSKIIIDSSLNNLKDLSSPERSLIIADEYVYDLYSKEFKNYRVISIPRGEKAKCLETVTFIYNRLIACEADRETIITVLGGGAACDTAAFAASTFKRGLRFGLVPTTLLAQVDAAIGGKNGINHGRYKNCIGTFAQPDFVLCIPFFLNTLDRSFFFSGMAEVVKAAIIGDADFFEYLENNSSGLLNQNDEIVLNILEKAIAIKVKIVEKDEREHNLRKILNFGHTLGHAIESVYGIHHGEAVSLGISFALDLSYDKKLCDAETVRRCKKLLKAFKLPVIMNFDKNGIIKIINFIKGDKKRFKNQVDFVYLTELGKPIIQETSFEELENALENLR